MMTGKRRAAHRRAALGAAGMLSALAACAHGPGATPAANEPGEVMRDELHGVELKLPPIEGGWQASPEGMRLAKDVRVEVGSFPLARAGTVKECRDTARERLATLQRAAAAAHEKLRQRGEAAQSDEEEEKIEAPRDQAVSDSPAPTWSFTRGEGEAAVRSRWAFLVRGADCMLVEVTGPLGSQAAEGVFETAMRTARALPVTPERQREIDVMAGMGFLQQRDPSSALDRFESLAGREPGFAIAQYGALMAAFEIGPTAYPRGLPHGIAALASERELSTDQRQLALSAVGVMELAQNRIKEAAQTLAELVVRAPDSAEGQYNYACALARLGDSAGAIDHLRAAFALEGGLLAHAREDEDLVSLRGRPEFEKLFGQ